MKHKIRNYPDIQRRCGITRDLCIIDVDLYAALRHTFGSHFDDSATELSQQLKWIRLSLAEIQAAVNRLPED